MTSENLAATENVDETQDQDTATSEPEEKLFRQEDLDRIVAERLSRERSKIEKKYSGIDVDHYNTLIKAEEGKQLEAKKRRGEFEKILEETVQKKDSQISDLQKQIHNVRVTGALISAAGKHRAINSEQVAELLGKSVRLTETGDVEVLDTEDRPRYDDSGKPLTVEGYVEEWLASNPHFVASTPGGSGSSNQATLNTGSVKIADLDLNRRDHREIYKKHREARRLES